ncbi:MAG: NAD(P)-dependent oxidoreductase [Chloroflexi bacterium]|nr:NAD(P)-dependent oxidoreductase [Chloroflexota bacterium]
MERVGFIGLGIMGRPMAINLLRAGFPLTVWNRTPTKTQALVSEGASAASSPRELAERSTVIITIVTDAPDVEEVVLGPQGVVHGAKSGSVVIDMSTISPRATREIAARLAQHGVHMLDAPVTGGEVGAQQGTLSIMVGGERAVFERCLPVFQALGKRITYIGGSGAGQTAKLVNQIIVAGTLLAVCEGLLFAARSGVDLQATLDAVSGGAAQSWQLENQAPRILRGDFAPGFMVKLMQKDLRIVLDVGRELALSLLATGQVHQLFRALEAQGLGQEGTQALMKVVEALGGARARLPGHEG